MAMAIKRSSMRSLDFPREMLSEGDVRVSSDEGDIAILFNPINVDESQKKESGSDSEGQKIPSEIPILPLRGLVIYPETVVPLTIGQPRSIRLIDEGVEGEERVIGGIAASGPERE